MACQLGCLGTRGARASGLRESEDREPGMAFSRNIELEDLAWSPSTLASGYRAIVPILVTGSPAGSFSLVLC